MRVGYSWLDDVLTPKQCLRLIEAGTAELMPALVGGGDVPNPETRHGQTSFFDQGCEVDDLMQLCVERMCWLSQKTYGCSLSHIEPVQFSDYREGDFYDWHYDQHSLNHGADNERHVSASIELTPPVEYEGGGLEFFAVDDPIPERKQGRMIMFSSMMVHRARKVTAGRRCSLVLWGHA